MSTSRFPVHAQACSRRLRCHGCSASYSVSCNAEMLQQTYMSMRCNAPRDVRSKPALHVELDKEAFRH